MQVIRTRSLATILRRAFLGFVVFIILILAMAAAIAVETPPRALLQHVSNFPIVHSDECNVKSLGIEDRSCLIYYDERNDAVWVVLFDDNVDITHVIVNVKGQEAVAWCRVDACA